MGSEGINYYGASPVQKQKCKWKITLFKYLHIYIKLKTPNYIEKINIECILQISRYSTVQSLKRKDYTIDKCNVFYSLS